MWACTLVIIVGCWRGAFVPSLTATSNRLIVRNPVQHVEISYNDIKEIGGGYYGLRVTRRRGPTVIVWAIQKSNVASWTGTGTRADEVSRVVMARVAAARAPS